MGWNNKNETLPHMQERGFELDVAGRKVPGVYWQPKTGGERLVMLGHGGGAHKKTEVIMHIADLLAAAGIASMAIDGPAHGDRRDPDIKAGPDAFATMWERGGGTQGIVADWRGALDFIEQEQGPRPTGWWGLSMGTMVGLPVTASEKRIKVALLGLMGTWGPNAADLQAFAPQLKCPVRFLLQWDDEIVPVAEGIKLFGLIGSKKKTMHINPGLHTGVPRFEIAGSVEYLDRYLR